MSVPASDISPPSNMNGSRSKGKYVLRKLHRKLIRWAVLLGFVRLRRACTGRRHIILTFHRVRPANQSPDPFDTCPSLSVTLFREILEYVRTSMHVVSLRHILRQDCDVPPAAAITFDDGWKDNYDIAFPVLRELHVPATVFVATGKIGSSSPFRQQSLGSVFRRTTQPGGNSCGEDLRSVLGLPSNISLTPDLYRTIVQAWKASDDVTPETVLSNITSATLDDSERTRCFLNAEEIREMSNSNIDFGSHTVSHAILPKQSIDRMRMELTDSRSALEAIVDCDVDMIAYPNGDYSPHVIRCAQDAGYRIGCSTATGALSGQEFPMRLPRIEPEWDFPTGSEYFEPHMLQWRAR